MKSIIKSTIKTTFMIKMIIPLAGCLDFECCKTRKTQEIETDQALQQAPSKSSCGHAGCTKNHLFHNESNVQSIINVDEIDEVEDNDDDANEEDID